MMINSGTLRLSAGASGENGSSVMATRCRFATAKTTIKTPSGNAINAVANLPSMSVSPGPQSPAKPSAKRGNRHASLITYLHCRVPVQPLPHFLAGLEKRHVFLINRDMRPSSRIATDPRRSLFHGEGSEPAQLDAVAMGERRDDLAKDRVDDILNIALVKMWVLRGNALNQFGFNHYSPHPPPWHEKILELCRICLAASSYSSRVPKRQQTVKIEPLESSAGLLNSAREAGKPEGVEHSRAGKVQERQLTKPRGKPPVPHRRIDADAFVLGEPIPRCPLVADLIDQFEADRLPSGEDPSIRDLSKQ